MAAPTTNPDVSDPPPDAGSDPGSKLVGQGDDEARAKLQRKVEILSDLRVLLAELESRMPPDG